MQSFDAVVVGAGFGGIYQLYKLRQLGISVRLYEKAPEVGGAWYWNQYPNCASDSPSQLYRYSWDKGDLLTYPWPNHVVTQEETLGYLKHVVKRHDLRKDMTFSAELKSATFDASSNSWMLQFATGEVVKTTYLVAATGAIHKANWLALPGREKFTGEQYHSGVWPESRDFKGKRVGIIGTGSSGAQLIVGLGKEAKHLTSFQRSAQYIVPNYRGAVDEEYRKKIVNNWDDVWKGVRNCVVGYNFTPITTPTFSVSPEERERVFESAWNGKNGFAFLYATFSDVLTNEAANQEICNFIKKKIGQIVEDPEKRRKLTPLPGSFYAKRPVCCAGYYEAFNSDHVDVVDTPLLEVTEKGIKTNDGKVHELDAIIYATGYETDGSWADIAITGPTKTLEQHWAQGAVSYLGLSEAGFPNFFMIVGPQSPVTNMPPLVEAQGDLIAALIAKAEKQNAAGRDKKVLITPTHQAEDEYMKECRKLGDESIFKKERSFLYGDNTPSTRTKGRSVLWYFGGMNTYLGKIDNEMNTDYSGFTFNS